MVATMNKAVRVLIQRKVSDVSAETRLAMQRTVPADAQQVALTARLCETSGRKLPRPFHMVLMSLTRSGIDTRFT
eukprot:990911-Amphidinium_carterae.1